MKQIKFGNRKAMLIQSSKVISKIKKKISNIGSFDISAKYYNFLNKKNINCIKKTKFLFTLNTFGKKHLLFLTKIGEKKYCIFINKKNQNMIMSRFRFTEDLFEGTLFDGEFIKKENGEWSFLISDLVYSHGINLITKNFLERREILDDILKNKYQSDNTISVCDIINKEYYNCKYMNSIVENHMKKLNYKCSGLIFKNLYNFSDNYLYIFLECRSDNIILNNKNENKSIKKISNNNVTNEIVFMIKTTSLPDVYELYCKDINNNLTKHSYAGVPNLKVSKLLRKVFKNKKINYDDEYSSESEIEDLEECDDKKMICSYHLKFKKWVPKKVVYKNNINNINLINIVETNLLNNYKELN